VNWLVENYKWLFDGVAGATALAVVGFFLHRRFSSSAPDRPQAATANATASSLNHSPVAAGSANNQNVNAPVLNLNFEHPPVQAETLKPKPVVAAEPA
jgi:hypothetical protein